MKNKKIEIPEKSVDSIQYWNKEGLSRNATTLEPINKKINKFGHLFGKNKSIQEKSLSF